jgi:hypothetical protein
MFPYYTYTIYIYIYIYIYIFFFIHIGYLYSIGEVVKLITVEDCLVVVCLRKQYLYLHTHIHIFIQCFISFLKSCKFNLGEKSMKMIVRSTFSLTLSFELKLLKLQFRFMYISI